MNIGLVFMVWILYGPCPQEAPAARPVEELSLKAGQTGTTADGTLRVRFVSVTQDSRCPKGEHCITAGNGQIVLELREESGEPVSVQVNTIQEPREIDWEGYVITLMDLSPYPVANRVIDPAEYLATLKIHHL